MVPATAVAGTEGTGWIDEYSVYTCRRTGGRCSENIKLSGETPEDPAEVLQVVAEGLQVVLAVG